jgi:hypothetical protein
MGLDISPFRCSPARASQVKQIQLSSGGFTLGSTRSPTLKGLDSCIEGWLAYELLSSPSAIRKMKALHGNEVDDEDDDEDGYDEDVDDEDSDDGEIGFGRPIRLSGNRILAGRAIPGMRVVCGGIWIFFGVSLVGGGVPASCSRMGGRGGRVISYICAV